MNVYSIIQFICGISFFLFGMLTLSENLEKTAGGKLERVLKRAQKKPALSLILGLVITMVIQSSSATSVMLVGLVNSGIMEFTGTLYIIFGANIGTTFTAWILSLAGIESSNMLVSMLKPENFTPFLALLGVILIMSAKKSRRRDAGRVLIGFAVLIYGMKFMTSAVSPLADTPEFASLMVKFENPFLSLIAGIVITALIQSSSASVGILQAFSLTGAVTWSTALPIIMGQNIGTCITALISCLGGSKNAKRVAAAHTSVNVIGTAVFFTLFEILRLTARGSFFSEAINPVGIAAAHTAFNILSTLLILPFSKKLEKLICRIVKDGAPKKDGIPALDERLFMSPSIAVSECMSKTREMAQLSRDTVLLSLEQISKYDKKVSDMVSDNEKRSDMYEDMLLTSLVRIAEKSLSDYDSASVSRMLYTVSDLERMCDHALHISLDTGELLEKTKGYSKEAMKELSVLSAAVKEITEITSAAFLNNDPLLAVNTEPLEQVIDKLTAKMHKNHVKRLQSGACTVEQGLTFANLLGDLERISDHCSNISAAVIELSHGSFETHRYLHDVKHENAQFKSIYAQFNEKYRL